MEIVLAQWELYINLSILIGWLHMQISSVRYVFDKAENNGTKS